MEKWEYVSGYEGIYMVSDLGRVASCKFGQFNIINGSKCKGYVSFNLRKDNKYRRTTLHRMMAMAFIPNPLNKPHINHIDGVKDNNLLSNIEWCTRSENMLHAHKIGLNKGKKKRVAMVTKSGELINIFDSYLHAEKETGVSNGHISKCCKGKRKTAGGYKWVNHG